MALIQCPECRQQVSDEVKVCPGCGYEIKRHQLEDEIADQQKKYNDAKTVCEKRKNDILIEAIEDRMSKVYKPQYSAKVYGSGAFFGIIALSIIYLLYLNVRDHTFDASTLFYALLPVLVGGFPFLAMYTKESEERKLYEKNPEAYKRSKAQDGIMQSLEYKARIKDVPEEKIMREELHKLTVLKEELHKLDPQPQVIVRQQATTSSHKCPRCGSTMIKNLSTLNRAASVAMVGLASSKIGKQYECKKCHHKW